MKADLALHRKPVESILAMCRAARKAGVESTVFLNCTLEQTRYLGMEPAVENNVFPPFVRLAAKKSTIENTPVGPDFWKQLGAELSFSAGIIVLSLLKATILSILFPSSSWKVEIWVSKSLANACMQDL